MTVRPFDLTPATAVPNVSNTFGLEGAWTGDYRAQKATVVLGNPRDGALTGRCRAPRCALPCSSTGVVRGKVFGSLGVGILSWYGRGRRRAPTRSSIPRAPNSMAGTLIGIVKGDVILGKIAAAGPDATVVREGQFELSEDELTTAPQRRLTASNVPMRVHTFAATNTRTRSTSKCCSFTSRSQISSALSSGTAFFCGLSDAVGHQKCRSHSSSSIERESLPPEGGLDIRAVEAFMMGARDHGHPTELFPQGNMGKERKSVGHVASDDINFGRR